MLTYAVVTRQLKEQMLTYADVCLTYADVCYTFGPNRESTCTCISQHKKGVTSLSPD
jgi:hypothetical protein